MLAFRCLCWLLLQCILILVMFLFSHCLCWVVINLIFDFNISLFMFTVCTTIINYFDCSRVSIEFLCLHICMSLSSLLVWRTKVDTRTGGWWMSLESERKDAKFVFCHVRFLCLNFCRHFWHPVTQKALAGSGRERDPSARAHSSRWGEAIPYPLTWAADSASHRPRLYHCNK